MATENSSLSPEDVVRMVYRDAERMKRRVIDLLQQGYTLHHWWDPPIEDYDEVYMIGFYVFWKPKARRLNETPTLPQP